MSKILPRKRRMQIRQRRKRRFKLKKLKEKYLAAKTKEEKELIIQKMLKISPSLNIKEYLKS